MNIILRKANKNDCNLLFEWANDEEVRGNSFNVDEIKYAEHVEWFIKKINSVSTYIFIALIENQSIGQVRIDIEDYDGIIDYSIDKKYRGMGYGNEILCALEKEILDNNVNIKRLIANVKYDNVKSKRVFEKNNYKKVVKEECLLYLKDMKLK